MDMLNIFDPIPKKDIEEKWLINEKEWNFTPIQFKELLEDEMFQYERLILKIKADENKKESPSFKFILEETLHMEVQILNLKEQISYMNNKILKES